ncbi:CysS/YqeB C-terminal domain-containing protein [Streptosporangium sp. H16]|uniref:glycosyltransferase n=1 Tax=Streptosporangium sp. H16 TaxID=3444184 RepID=UPI003F792C7E
MSEVPPNVTVLAERRAKARAEHDHAASDALRDEIRTEGWLVRDTADGFELIPSPSFDVWPTLSSLPEGGSPGAERGGSSGEPGASTAPGWVSTTSGAAGVGGDAEGRVDARDARDARDAATGRDDSADPGRVAEAADPGRHPGRLGDLDAERVAETEAAPQQTPEGSELVGRADDLGGHPERMVSSQLLWDGSLSVSRLDETIVPPAGVEEPKAARPTVTVALLVDGRPDELRECVRALVARTEARILALDLGDVEGAGAVLQELVEEFPRRVEAWHVAETPHWQGGSAGWGESRDRLLRLDTSDVHVVMDTSVVLDGDAVTPLVKALDDDVTAAGWKGMNPREDCKEWLEAEPGEVRGLLGHLFAVRRDTALAAGGFPADARYYRNADLEFSLRLPGTLVALGKDLPVHQERHRRDDGVDPEYRDGESRRTYDRVLKLLRSP